jgi:hypothetical protein
MSNNSSTRRILAAAGCGHPPKHQSSRLRPLADKPIYVVEGRRALAGNGGGHPQARALPAPPPKLNR